MAAVQLKECRLLLKPTEEEEKVQTGMVYFFRHNTGSKNRERSRAAVCS